MEKISKRLGRCFKKMSLVIPTALLSTAVFAQDKLAGAMAGDIQDMLGGQGTFWKAFILVDIILAAAALVKTKNPMVFLSVFAIALIPGYLISVFVF